jgi:hypothetical protein
VAAKAQAPRAVKEEVHEEGDEASNIREVSRRVKISSQVDVRTVDELPPRKSQRVPTARMRSTPQKSAEDHDLHNDLLLGEFEVPNSPNLLQMRTTLPTLQLPEPHPHAPVPHSQGDTVMVELRDEAPPQTQGQLLLNTLTS